MGFPELIESLHGQFADVLGKHGRPGHFPVSLTAWAESNFDAAGFRAPPIGALLGTFTMIFDEGFIELSL